MKDLLDVCLRLKDSIYCPFRDGKVQYNEETMGKLYKIEQKVESHHKAKDESKTIAWLKKYKEQAEAIIGTLDIEIPTISTFPSNVIQMDLASDLGYANGGQITKMINLGTTNLAIYKPYNKLSKENYHLILEEIKDRSPKAKALYVKLS